MILDRKARMPLYSVLSLAAIIILCAAAWKMLDFAKTTYTKISSFKNPINRAYNRKNAVNGCFYLKAVNTGRSLKCHSCAICPNRIAQLLHNPKGNCLNPKQRRKTNQIC